MEKQIKFKHGVSVNGELQIHPHVRYMEGDVIKHEVREPTFSPADVQKMGDYDTKSQQIVEALYVQEVLEEWQQECAYFWEDFAKPGFRELINQDRMIDELWRVSIRQRNQLVEDSKIISLKYHRSWIMPGGAFLDKDILSKTLAKKFHTPENIGIYQAAMVANDLVFESGLNGEAVIQ